LYSELKSRLQKMKWRFGALLVIGIGVIAYLGYIKLRPKAAAADQYETAQVQKGTLVVSVAATGQVATTNSAQVTTTATGVISKLFAANGQTVASGAPIAQLDLDEAGKLRYSQALATYQSAVNSLDSARNRLNTLQSSLFTTNQKLINDAVARNLSTSDPTYIVQNSEWLASENEYKNQQKVILVAQTSLNNSSLALRQASRVIYSPISGTLNGLALQVGSVITTGSESTKLANVITPALPMLNFNLTEVDVAKVQVGQKATIVFDAYPEKTFTGKVVSVDTVGTVSSSVTSYPVALVLDTTTAEIFPNMAAAVNIIIQTKPNVLVVPNSAISTQNGQTVVQIMRNLKPEYVTVQTSLASDTQTEIISGLSEGETIVTATISSAPAASNTTSSPFGSLGGGNRGGFNNNFIRLR
jgi:multidrug efflux pump subunit AcrA (membrane-fusion protein)